MNQFRLAHLQMMQGAIERMAKNSFSLKSLSVTLVAATLWLSAANANRSFAVVALMPAAFFWSLDAYYLRQERLFRALYDQVRLERDDLPVSFSMDTSAFAAGTDTVFRTMWSRTQVWYHGPIVAVIAAVLIRWWLN